MLDLGHVNLWAIFFSGTAGSVLAYLWYCPKCFGKLWKKHFKEFSKDTFWIYLINILAAFVLAYTLAQIIFFVGAKNIFAGALVGFSLWTFFTITTSAIDIYLAKRNPATYILNFGYQLLSMILMGGILGILN